MKLNQVKKKSKPKDSPEEIKAFIGRHFGAKLLLYQEQLLEHILANDKENKIAYCNMLKEEVEDKRNRWIK